MNILQSLLFPSSDGWLASVGTAFVFVFAIVLIGTLTRAIFGKNAPLTRAVSAVLSIAMVYMTAVLLFIFLPSIRDRMGQLPFLTVTDQYFTFWSLSDLPEDLLYSSILKLALLSILVNALEVLIPKGKKFLTWYLYRLTTALTALACYILFGCLIERFLPQIYSDWAKAIILGLTAIIAITWLLKILMSIILTVINPVIGGLHAFFFTNPVGLQLSKSIMTTLLCMGIIHILNQKELAQFAFSDFSLSTYGPASIFIILALYFFGKLL